jgi:hypothetical protein
MGPRALRRGQLAVRRAVDDGLVTAYSGVDKAMTTSK